jgi:pyrroline-5-carboxylate reductase
MDTVLKQLAPLVSVKHLVVSIAAGIPLKRIEDALDCRVVRVMPNTPCLVSAAASAFSSGSRATEADAKLIDKLLSVVGVSKAVPEKLMNAVTGEFNF